MSQPTPHIDSGSSVPQNGPMNVLIIEDDAGYSYFLTEALQKRGHNVICASSHDQARRKLEAEPVDVIFCDGSTTTAYKGNVLYSYDVECSGSAFLKEGDHKKDGSPVPIVTMSGGVHGGYNGELEQQANLHGGPVYVSSKSELFDISNEGGFMEPCGVIDSNLDAALKWAQEQKHVATRGAER